MKFYKRKACKQMSIKSDELFVIVILAILNLPEIEICKKNPKTLILIN